MIRRVLMWLVRGYRRRISPLLPVACRFTPTCSEYALDCLRMLPLHRAMPRIVWRILRCQPLCRGGYDPVVRGTGEGVTGAP